MALACIPCVFVRQVSPVADASLLLQSRQFKHKAELQSIYAVRVAAQRSLISRTGFGVSITRKVRGNTALAFDSSESKPFTVEELEESLSSSTFPDHSVDKQPNPSELGFDSSETDFGSSEKSDLSSESGFPEVEPPPLAKLYAGNLPWDFDNEQLEALFKQHGSVFVAEVVLDKDTGKSRGFGFVYMNSPEDAEVAIQQLNGKDIGGRTLKVSHQESPEERMQRLSRDGETRSNVNKLFVGNLPWNITEQELEHIFSKFGRVVESKVVCDRDTGRSRGFGFVTFASADEANAALTSVNGMEYESRDLRVARAGERPPARPSFF